MAYGDLIADGPEEMVRLVIVSQVGKCMKVPE